MTLKPIQKLLAIGIVATSTGFATQVMAAPIFSFTEYSGFVGGQTPVALYSNEVTGDASVIPAVGPLYSMMSWNASTTPHSSLVLSTVEGPAPLVAETWTTISSLTHNNRIIPNAADWGPQSIWGRFVITDSDGGASTVLDDDSSIEISLTETPNVGGCPFGSPVGTTCDDFFSFTSIGLGDLNFAANDGSEWLATFRFANLINAVQEGNTVFTGEARSSSLDVQVMLSQVIPTPVPEPTTLGVLGLGLFGLGLVRPRKQNT